MYIYTLPYLNYNIVKMTGNDPGVKNINVLIAVSIIVVENFK